MASAMSARWPDVVLWADLMSADLASWAKWLDVHGRWVVPVAAGVGCCAVSFYLRWRTQRTEMHGWFRYGVRGSAIVDGAEAEDWHLMRLHDGRTLGLEQGLREEGFMLTPSKTCLSPGAMYDAQTVEDMYYPEVQKLVASRTGASRVIPFDHILRNDARLSEEQRETKTTSGTTRFLSNTISRVHNDYTVRSGLTRAQQLLEPHCSAEELQAVLKSDFAIINVWRPLVEVRTSPLALLRWRSIRHEDVQAVRLVYKHRVGETARVFHSAEHEWVHYPHMTMQEALLFKTFDSNTEAGNAQFALHSAFEFATECADPDAPPRQSIEVRCLVLFDPAFATLAKGHRAPHLVPGSSDADSRVSLLARELVPQVPGQW